MGGGVPSVTHVRAFFLFNTPHLNLVDHLQTNALCLCCGLVGTPSFSETRTRGKVRIPPIDMKRDLPALLDLGIRDLARRAPVASRIELRSRRSRAPFHFGLILISGFG